MSHVAARERAAEAPSRLSRVRCVHCAMPAASPQATCWSCGLDPLTAAEAEPPHRPPAGELPRPWHTALLVACAATLVLVALLGTVLMLDPHPSGQGPRGFADRFRGESWLRAEVGGATAEFPARPVRASDSSPPGTTGTTEVLVATGPGIRVELRASPLDSPLLPAQLVDAYGNATGQQVRRWAPVKAGGASAVDALLEGPQGATRVRAVVTATAAYLLAVTGPAAAFERVAGSLTTGP